MVYSLVEYSIVYHSNEYPDEDLIYKNLRKKRKLEQRIRFLIDIFLDIRYRVEIKRTMGKGRSGRKGAAEETV